jgi:Domain of unknown function (DUF4349)/Putative zinc-finger
MSATTHPFAPEEIMAHLDGELSPAESQSVSSHIESCSECSSLATSLRSSSKSLSNWRVGPVPSQLQERVPSACTSASRSLQGLNPLSLFYFGSRQRKRWVLSVAAAGCALVFLFLISTRNRGPYESALYASKPKSVSLQSGPQMLGGHGSRSGPEVRQELAARVADSATEWQFSEPGKNAIGPVASKQPTQGATAEFGKLRLYSKLQRPSDPQMDAPMIARTVSLSIIAKDFDSSRASLDAILARHHGYAADLNVATPQGSARSLQASLRIPAPQLTAALAELKSLGRVELENQNGEEVTQQHADLVARLKNSRETEQRLQAILTQRTGKISDVLEVEQEIARVRGEIEQMEAEQKNLEHRVDFATIDLKLSEEYKAKLDSPAPAISTLIHNAAINGYRNVSDTLLSIVLFFAEYGPVLCFWLLLFSIPALLVWRRWRHATAAI